MANEILNTWKNRAKNDKPGLSGKALKVVNIFVDFIAGKISREIAKYYLCEQAQKERGEFNYFTEAIQDLDCIN